MSILSTIANKLLAFKGFKTKRKLVIIESDDWGSRRTDNVNVRTQLNSISSAVANDPFSQYDNIAGLDDLTALFEVLSSVRDKHGHPACITINVTTANPDFEKIRSERFERFYYEPFNETIVKRTRGKEILALWKAGMDEKFLFPQLHGREHVHALAWLRELQMGNADLLRAFDLNAYGIPYTALYKQRRKNLQAALDHYGIEGEMKFQEKWVSEGAEIFENYFGFRSQTFIPTAYIWHRNIESVLAGSGIKGIQGLKLQYEPVLNNRSLFTRNLRYTGQIHISGITSLVRNVFFEPFSEPKKDWVDSALTQISFAFTRNHPAVIGAHRINFIGSLSTNNRDKSLWSLKKLLSIAVNRWPDVEFINTSKLLNLLEK